MTTYSVSNKKYNVNFDLKLYSFHDFNESFYKKKYFKIKNLNFFILMNH